MARIFFSYSRTDTAFAQHLVKSLTDAGHEAWIDQAGIEVGTKWSSAIQQALDSCDLMVLIVSPESMSSENVADEWQYFLDNKKTVVPVIHRAARLHFQLSRLQYVNFEKYAYEHAVQKLLLEIERKQKATAIDLIKQPDLPVGDEKLKEGVILAGRYQVLGVIGGGSTSTVYRARDLAFTQVNRVVAVKEIMLTVTGLVEKTRRKKIFERETNLLALLNHRAIPVFLDVFDRGDRCYIVMQYVDGHDLLTIIEQNETLIPAQTVIGWAIELCNVLHYLHTLQPDPVIYRNLKPADIMIDCNGHVRLVDFGVAKMMAPTNRAATMIGTEGYSAPEQYRGTSTPQSDIYGLAATLHHLLTRSDPRYEPPFSFAERRIRSLNPAVPAELEAIVMKGLANDPTQRFKSANEMEKALAQLLLPRRQTGEIVQQKETQETRAPEPNGPQLVWTFAAEDEVRSAAAVLNDTVYVGGYDHVLYALRKDNGQLKWRKPTQAGIAVTPVADENAVFVGSEDHLQYRVDLKTGQLVWTFQTGGCIRSSGVLMHESLFFGSDDGHLYVVDPQSGRFIWKFDAGSPIRARPLVTGESVIFGCENGEVWCLDLSGVMRWRYAARKAVFTNPIAHRGVIYFGAADGHVYAVDAEDGLTVWRFRTNGPVYSSPTIAKDLLYFGSSEGKLYALGLEKGSEIWHFDIGKPIVSSPLVHNNAVYFGGTDRHLYSLKSRSGELRWKYKTGGGIVAAPVIADDLIIVGSLDRKVYALKG